MGDRLSSASKLLVYIEGTEKRFMEIGIEFLFSYLFRFEKKNGLLFLKSKPLEIQEAVLQNYLNFIRQAFTELIDDCYQEPSIRERQRKGPYFEKFIYKGKKYIVNYRATHEGRLLFFLYHKILALEETLENGKKVILHIE